MERITVKFHRIYRYSDPTNRFKSEIKFYIIDDKIMGTMILIGSKLVSMEVIIGPFDFEVIPCFENNLRECEKDGIISNLSFEDEIEMIKIEMPISPMMN
jgi:hypothetical protein